MPDTPEGRFRVELARQGYRLQPGTKYRIIWDGTTRDANGDEKEGPHSVGSLEAVGKKGIFGDLVEGEHLVKIAPTAAGRDVGSLLLEGDLDVVAVDKWAIWLKG